MLKRLFTEHPADAGETYFEHFCTATYFAVRMFFGAIACLIHAIFPFICVRTGSGTVSHLHDVMVTNRKAAREKIFGTSDVNRAA